MCAVYSLGHVSLAALNPAVAVAMGIRRILSFRAMLFYIAAELIGGILGGLTAHAFLPTGASATVPSTGRGYTLGQCFFAELLATFMLCLVVLNVGCSSDTEGNSFFGLAIGFTLSLNALVMGQISGAVLNPAVGMLALLAPVSGVSIPSNAWVYFVAPPISGVLAAGAFRLLSPKDHAPKNVLMKGPVDHRLGLNPVANAPLYDGISSD
jgi:aquaporin Z